MARRLTAILFACGLSGAAATALAVTTERGETADDPIAFPRPAIVRQQVRFWERIFGTYPTTTVIVHDMDVPDRLIDIIDYKKFAGRADTQRPVPRKERDQVTEKYLKRYQKAAERFATEGATAVRHGAIEKRLHKVYSRTPELLARLLSGTINLRAQTGLADDFRQATAVAKAYLPYMEQVFRDQGVPPRLTRLAFVESMFNVRARSKVGASGLFQFMPATARIYIHVNRLVDERNNPFKATKAAAMLLKTNHQELGTWPLAITAYNHGRSGMEKAIKHLATDDLGTIIGSYRSNSFGFASSNFYAEFLAAAATYDRLEREGLTMSPIALPETAVIALPRPLSVADLLSGTSLTAETLAEHNPCIRGEAIQGRSKKPLPALFELRVPKTVYAEVRTALSGRAARRYARR